MAVFTSVTPEEVSQWLDRYSVGALTELRGIAAGIENTNYFVSTTHGRFVLTIFEKLTFAELPFYLNLMSHLAGHGIPCPAPIQDDDQGLLGTLKGKPAALVTRLPGVAVTHPEVAHCRAVGTTLANMHLAARSFTNGPDNPRGPKWWRQTGPRVMPFLDASRKALLENELHFQASHRIESLPRGPVHADLFRDNVLFTDQSIGGVIDFYFAGVDAFAFDLAVTVNDWCVLPDGTIDLPRAEALLESYATLRPLEPTERSLWPVMLRAAALRFWISRLFDFYLPRPGELVQAHDPEHFRRILELRIRDAGRPPRVWP